MCGVFGICSPERDVARVTFFGLFALQHRGQESAGIAVSDRGNVTAMRDLGLVSQVFDERNLRGLQGEIAIGHTRYSTTGSTHWANAQPLVHQGRSRTVALGHNGNLTNAAALREELSAEGVRLRSSSDSEVIAGLLAHDAAPLEEAVANAMPRLEGAYTVVAIAEGRLAAFRDPHGFRPLSLGRLDGDWVVASETCSLDLVGAELEREVRPGELVIVDEDGCDVTQAVPQVGGGAFCIFELFYLARPDSRLAGVEVHNARVRMGERLAEEAPVEADLVMPIPDSGTPAAIGFSRALSIPFSEGLIKNRYVGRTFIQPDQGLREQGVKLKFNPLAEVRGQADRGRRRLDRARHHDAPDRGDALRGRRARGARARVLAADRLTLLLRDRLRRRGPARGGRPGRRRRSRAGRRDLARLPLARGAPGGDAAAGVELLPGLPHARLSDARAARAPPGQDAVRAALVLEHPARLRHSAADQVRRGRNEEEDQPFLGAQAVGDPADEPGDDQRQDPDEELRVARDGQAGTSLMLRV